MSAGGKVRHLPVLGNWFIGRLSVCFLTGQLTFEVRFLNCISSLLLHAIKDYLHKTDSSLFTQDIGYKGHLDLNVEKYGEFKEAKMCFRENGVMYVTMTSGGSDQRSKRQCQRRSASSDSVRTDGQG